MEISRDQVVMPIIVATMIDKDDFVFKMAEILGKLDYRKLRSSYRRRWRKIEANAKWFSFIGAKILDFFFFNVTNKTISLDYN